MEELAAIEHQRWSDWQSWCHKVLRENCPSEELEKVLERWDRQIATPYSELSEAEKESDREQVRRYLPTITTLIEDTERREREEETVRKMLVELMRNYNIECERYGQAFTPPPTLEDARKTLTTTQDTNTTNI